MGFFAKLFGKNEAADAAEMPAPTEVCPANEDVCDTIDETAAPAVAETPVTEEEKPVV